MNNEFISTNSNGDYASYNLTQGITRKYHGLLIKNDFEDGKHLLVSTLIEKVEVDEKVYDFSANYYQNAQQPGIVKYLVSAHYLPYPTQIFQLGPIKIIKQIDFSDTDTQVVITYTINSPIKAKFSLEPLLSYRNTHNLGLSSPISDWKIQKETTQRCELKTTPSGNIQIISNLAHSLNFVMSADHHYFEEEERGYESTESLVNIGNYSLEIAPGTSTHRIVFKFVQQSGLKKIFMVSKMLLEPSENTSVVSEVSRFKDLHPQIDENFAEYLVYNARKFIIKSDTRNSILAGYHWFGEWSRDTFISFKGLLLGLGRFHQANRVLLDWSKYISIGLLPNTMEGLHYNSLDGVLWYIMAVWHYWQATKDKSLILHLLPKLERIVYAFARGSKYGIGLSPKGYLIWTDSSKALTWMDAIVKEPVVNRTGAAVEIQALWYNALQIIESLSKECNYKLVNLNLFNELELLLEDNFDRDFWLIDQKYYADYIDLENQANKELRPNQLFAFSLPFRLGKPNRFADVLKVVEAELLTPVGLRTLSPRSTQYQSNYRGNQTERDLAYHQGTIWTWLLLPYYLSILEQGKYSSESKQKVNTHIGQLWNQISSKQLLHMPELFTADLKPAGALSQAWSVAAIMEATMQCR